MKFTIDKSTLLDVLAIVAPVAQKSTGAEILENVCIIIKDNTARFVTTDSMASVDLTIPIKTETNGSMCINATKIFSLAKVMDDGDIEFEMMPNKVTVKITEEGGSISEISTLCSDRFPLPKSHDTILKVSVSSHKLSEMLNKGMKFVSSDETRIALTGMLLSFESDIGILVLSSTDSYKMFSSHCQANGTGNFQSVLPFHAAQVLERMLKEVDSDEVEIKFDDNFMSVNIGEVHLISKLIDIPYPDLSKIFSMTRNDSVSFKKLDFLKVLRRASIITKKDIVPQVNFIVNNDHIILESFNAKAEKIYSEIRSTTTLENVYKFSLNIKQIQSVISLIENNTMTIEFATDKNEKIQFVGIFIVDESNIDDLYVVMPLR